MTFVAINDNTGERREFPTVEALAAAQPTLRGGWWNVREIAAVTTTDQPTTTSNTARTANARTH